MDLRAGGRRVRRTRPAGPAGDRASRTRHRPVLGGDGASRSERRAPGPGLDGDLCGRHRAVGPRRAPSRRTAAPAARQRARRRPCLRQRRVHHRDEEQLREQLRGWVGQGIPRVKLKIGESWGTAVRRDLDRVALARRVVGPDVEVFVDANGGYDAQQAVRVARRLDELAVTWFEEPVSSDDHVGLRRVRESADADVTAGEYGDSLAYFAHLLAADTVDCVQVDVTRCGGYTEWRRIAALAASYGLEVSGHCAPSLHAAVAMATPGLRHLEWFSDHVRIERRFLDGFPAPDGGVIVPPDGPGHGLTVRETDLARYRVA